jgi:NAD(P) transhydrogenase subunit alpha
MNRWIAMSILFLAAGMLWQFNSATAQNSAPSGEPLRGLASEPSDGPENGNGGADQGEADAGEDASESAGDGSVHSRMLVGSLAVFMLAVLVGFEIIAKVPPTLHTPLMSGSNAISGITIVGALLVAGGGGSDSLTVASLLGLCAIILASINVVGGFLVTHRMLAMFNKR